MNKRTFLLPVVVALAAAGLAACDVNVKPPESSPAATAPAPGPQTTETPPQATAQPTAPVDATPTPVQPTADASLPGTPAAPDTGAMGAPAGTDGVAAPTELSRFMEENARKDAGKATP